MTSTASSADQQVVDLATLKKQQQAVIEAQSAASAAIAAAKQALAAQAEACAKAYQNAEATEVDQACQQALDTVRDRQDDVSAAQDTLQKALDALAATLTKAIEALAQQPQQPQPPKQPQKQPSAPRAEAPQNSPQTKTPTAAELAAAQAQIEQAEADLVTAEQARAQATLRSTRAGTVASVAVGAGDKVSSGDIGAVVVGGTAVTVAVDVPETKIGSLKVGQVARVSAPGQKGSAEGHVSAIGMTGDSSSGTVTYPVTITVDAPDIPLPTGSQALVEIVLSTAKNVLTVPLSAVTRRGESNRVQVWDGTKLANKSVTLGTVGTNTVEVTQGLDAGDKVVLADLDQAIEGAADSLSQRNGFPGGAPMMRIEGGPGGGPKLQTTTK